MSTDYLPKTPIPFDLIKGLRLKGVWECQTEHTTPDNACLTDGDNYLWATRAENGGTTFTRFSTNLVHDILETLSAHFGVEFVSEHEEPEFSELVEGAYREDFITIPLPTDENPGPWRKVYP